MGSESQTIDVQERPALWTRRFIFITLVNLFVFVGFQMVTPTLALYLQQFSTNSALVGATIGSFTLLAVTARPFVGRALDRYGRRTLLMVGLVIFAAATLGYAAAAGVGMIFATRMVHGLGFGIASTASSTIASDLVPASRRAEGLGYFGMATTIAQSFAPVIGLAIVDALGFAPLFVTAAGLSGVSLFMAASVGETLGRDPSVPRPTATDAAADPASHRPSSLRGWITLLIEPRALPPALTVFLVAIIFGGIISFVPVYAVEQGFGNPGVFYTIYSLAVLSVRLFVGQLVDRRGSLIVIVPALFLATVGLAILGGIPDLFDTPLGPGGVLLGGVVLGLSAGATIPTLLAVAISLVPPTRRGAANATFFMAFDLGIGFGAFVLGAVANVTGYGGMYVASGILPMLALALLWRMRRHFAAPRA